MGTEGNLQPITNESPRKTSVTRDSQIRASLASLAEIYSYVIPPNAYPLWVHLLAGVPDTALAPAFSRLAKSFKPTAAVPFPVPAHLLELVEQAGAAAAENDAENAWQKTYNVIRRQSPDFGWQGPKLVSRVDHAVRAAGGWVPIWWMADDKLVWAKKAFIECYLRDEKLQNDAPLLSAAPAIRVLLEGAAIKSLPPGTTPPPPEQLSPEDIAAGRAKVLGDRPPVRELTDAEFDARRAELKRQGDELRKRNPAWFPPKEAK